jgi:gamma-glutamyltranspeptidase/glutathione hydrolase
MFSWNFPYRSQRMPVLAKNVVATSQPLAAQAGLAMMAKGGNAVDAGHRGGDHAHRGRAHLERHRLGRFRHPLGRSAPRGHQRLGPLARRLDSGTLRRAQRDADAGMGRGHRPGLRLGVGDALQALRQAALRGPVRIRDQVRARRATWSRRSQRSAGPTRRSTARASPSSPWTFLPKDRAPHPGERFYCPQQAETLEDIAASKGESFYRGTLAERIALASQADDGADDCRGTSPSIAATGSIPSRSKYRGYHLHEMPPNGQGIAALSALGILRNVDVASLPCRLRRQPARADRGDEDGARRYLGERDRSGRDAGHAPSRCSTRPTCAARAKQIDMKRAQDHAAEDPAGGGTVYLTTADERGMMFSYIQSNYMGFRLGHRRAGHRASACRTGRRVQPEAGHPNEVGPRKRPFKTIIPGFLTRNGQPVMAFGVMGGNMQSQGHVQMVTRWWTTTRTRRPARMRPRWIVNPISP